MNASSESWTLTKLEDAMEVIIDYRGKTPTKTSHGVPLVTAKIVKSGRIETPTEFIAETDFESWMRRGMPKPGDVVITTEAPLGEVAQLDSRRVALAQRLICLRGKPGLLDNTFLRFVLQGQSVQEQLTARSSGTTVLGIRQSELRRVMLPVPPLAEQRAIAEVLVSLDDKIELNRRLNQTLEALAAAIFKAWFIDFEPVKAKAAGAKSFPSMPQPVFDALPSSLVPAPNSPSGEVPKGWRVGVVGEEVEVVGGSTPSTSEPRYWDGVHCWATPKDLSKLDSPILLDTERKITDAGLSGISSGLLPVGSLLLSSRAPIGYLALVRVPTAINQGFIGMRCSKLLSAEFMLHWCQERMDDIKGRANGTTFQEISKGSFRPMPIVVPDETTAKAFDSLVKPLYEMVAANVKENGTLAALRDSLLPKLLSGEVRVAGNSLAASGLSELEATHGRA